MQLPIIIITGMSELQDKIEGLDNGVFLKKPEIVLTREQLIQKVWETDASVESKNLDNYIYFLRKRIRTVESECVLSSVYGSGFILEVKHDTTA